MKTLLDKHLIEVEELKKMNKKRKLSAEEKKEINKANTRRWYWENRAHLAKKRLKLNSQPEVKDKMKILTDTELDELHEMGKKGRKPAIEEEKRERNRKTAQRWYRKNKLGITPIKLKSQPAILETLPMKPSKAEFIKRHLADVVTIVTSFVLCVLALMSLYLVMDMASRYDEVFYFVMGSVLTFMICLWKIK